MSESQFRFKRTTIDELNKTVGKRYESLFLTVARAIQHCSKFRFTADTERTFILFIGGESIRLLYEAQVGPFLNDLESERADRDKLDGLCGMIYEAGTDEQPVLIHGGDNQDAIDAWIELHRLYGVPLSAEEETYFGVENSELFEDDEGDEEDPT